jgi:hypothetical protein
MLKDVGAPDEIVSVVCKREILDVYLVHYIGVIEICSFICGADTLEPFPYLLLGREVQDFPNILRNFVLKKHIRETMALRGIAVWATRFEAEERSRLGR